MVNKLIQEESWRPIISFFALDPDFRIEGKQFEKFVNWFQKTDAIWASQIKKFGIELISQEIESRLCKRFNFINLH